MMNRTTIAPGVSLTTVEADKFNTCRVSIYFVRPAKRETATADALLPIVMERGYADCPDMTELSKRLSRLYGASLRVDTFKVGANRVLSVSVTGIKDKFALEGELLTAEYAKIALGTAFTPYLPGGTFDPECVAIEKQQLRELLEGEINEKRTYCIRQAKRKFFEGMPEGIEANGYLDELDSVDEKTLTEAFREMIRSSRIEVFALGAEADVVRAQVLAALADTKRAPAHLAPINAPAPCSEKSFTQNIDAVQGKLCMLFTYGGPVAEEDAAAARVAAALLGGTATSRLFVNVREKQSLCYYCAAAFQLVAPHLCIDSGVEPQNAARAKAAILHELEALREGPISDQELSETKRTLLSALGSVGDSLHSMETWCFHEIMRGTEKEPADLMHEIALVTADDVHRVLGRLSLSVTYLLTKEAQENG